MVVRVGHVERALQILHSEARRVVEARVDAHPVHVARGTPRQQNEPRVACLAGLGEARHCLRTHDDLRARLSGGQRTLDGLQLSSRAAAAPSGAARRRRAVGTCAVGAAAAGLRRRVRGGGRVRGGPESQLVHSVATPVGQHQRTSWPAEGEGERCHLQQAQRRAVQQGGHGGREGGGIARARGGGVRRNGCCLQRADPRRAVCDVYDRLVVGDGSGLRAMEGRRRACAIARAVDARAGQRVDLAADHMHDAHRVIVRVAHEELPRPQGEGEPGGVREPRRLAAAVCEANDALRAGERGGAAGVELNLAHDVVGRIGHEEQPRVRVNRQASRLVEARGHANAIGVAAAAASKGGDIVAGVGKAANFDHADAMAPLVGHVQLAGSAVHRQRHRAQKGGGCPRPILDNRVVGSK